LRQLLMIKLGNAGSVSGSLAQQDEKQVMQKQVDNISYSELINLLQRIIEYTNNYKVASVPQLALELVVIKCAEGGKLEKPADLKPEKKEVPIIPVKKAEKEIKKEENPEEPVIKAQASKKIDLPIDLWAQLCQKISTTNPALGALIKSSQTKQVDDCLVIKTSSQFLHDMISKKSNLVLINNGLQQLGFEDIYVKCEFSKTADQTADNVAEVFDII